MLSSCLWQHMRRVSSRVDFGKGTRTECWDPWKIRCENAPMSVNLSVFLTEGLSICMYACLSVYVGVCVCEREKERESM